MQVRQPYTLKLKMLIFCRSQTHIKDLSEAFYVGKPLTVRVITLDPSTSRIVVSVKQAAPTAPATAAEKLEVGEAVSGTVSQVHTEQVVVKLEGSGLTALLSLSNLSNQRHTGIEELRRSLKQGEKIDDLVVVSKNPVSGLIIVNIKKTIAAKKEKAKEDKAPSGISANVKAIDAVEVGQIVSGTVQEQTSQGYMIQLPNNLRGRVHPCDSSDDLVLAAGRGPLSVGEEVKCYVLAVNKSKRAIDLSTRLSRVEGKEDVVDREINTVDDLKQGETVRGLVKNIAGHGVFVSLGRNVTARIMIKELFDEVSQYCSISSMLA